MVLSFAKSPKTCRIDMFSQTSYELKILLHHIFRWMVLYSNVFKWVGLGIFPSIFTLTSLNMNRFCCFYWVTILLIEIQSFSLQNRHLKTWIDHSIVAYAPIPHIWINSNFVPRLCHFVSPKSGWIARYPKVRSLHRNWQH